MNSKIAKKKSVNLFKMHFVDFNFKIVLHTGILEATITLKLNLIYFQNSAGIKNDCILQMNTITYKSQWQPIAEEYNDYVNYFSNKH